MKTFIIFFSLSISFWGCDEFESDELNKENVRSSFYISDVNGNFKNQFTVGEEFALHLNITNLNKQSLHFSHSFPIVSYSILLNDSVIATSEDYMAFIEPFILDDLSDNESFSDYWIAPNTPGRISSVGSLILSAGIYKARINHNVFFDEFKISQLPEIEFQVVQ